MQKDMYDDFVRKYEEATKKKCSIGKSCIRMKKNETIPYEVFEELFKKMSVREYIALYTALRDKE